MKKYQLRDGDTYIREFVEDDGTHVTMIKDREGNEKCGMSIDVPEDVAVILEEMAQSKNMTLSDCISDIVECALIALIAVEKEKIEKRKAIEEIST